MARTPTDLDPAVAVDKAIPAGLRKAFADCLVDAAERWSAAPHDWQGAPPSRYLASVEENGEYADEIEPWWLERGSAAMTWLLDATGLPATYCAKLLKHALVVHQVAGFTEDPMPLAYAASVWAKGYAEGQADEARYHQSAGL